MPKYEREEKSFRGLREHYEKEEATAFLYTQILLGWETEEVKRLLANSAKNAKAIISELDKLLDTIERRRTQ